MSFFILQAKEIFGFRLPRAQADGRDISGIHFLKMACCQDKGMRTARRQKKEAAKKRTLIWPRILLLEN
jgi:hypothetical protein